MIYCIDVVSASTTPMFLQQWRHSIAEQARASGFVAAKLHQVYKRLHRNGYDLISLIAWDNDHALDRARQHRDWFRYLSDQQFERNNNRYHVVNQGHGPDVAQQHDNVVITNPYRISAAEAPQHAQMWQQSKQHMENRDGFVDAYLFQCCQPDAEYYYFSRAQWRSEALFMKQFEGRDFKAIIAPFEGIFSICLSQICASEMAAAPELA